jgi:hypothetical protein
MPMRREALQTFLPLRVQSMLTVGLIGWVHAWLSTSKLVALALGTSSLSAHLPTGQFAVCLALPIEPAHPGTTAPPRTMRMLSHAAWCAASMCSCFVVLTPLLRGIALGLWTPSNDLDMAIHCALSDKCNAARGISNTTMITK